MLDKIYTSEPTARTDAKTLSTAHRRASSISIATCRKEYIYSSERFVKYNLFNPKFDVKWKRVSLDYLCIYQKIMHSSLLEFLNARDMVKSDHDSYVHDDGEANLV